MTTFVEARDSIVSLIHTALQNNHPTLPIFWENTLEVDLNAVGNLFVRIELDFDDAMQMTINDIPEHQTFGTVYFTVFMKEGTGTRESLILMQSFTDVVKYQMTPTFVFTTPRPGKKDGPRDGWISQELVAPFWFDSLD